MKAYLIDPARRTVTLVEYSGLADLQRMVGGYIEAAEHWPTGDVCYVDEEGRLKGKRHGFIITQPHVGNGVVVGRETDEAFGEDGEVTTLDPVITIEQLQRELDWTFAL